MDMDMDMEINKKFLLFFYPLFFKKDNIYDV